MCSARLREPKQGTVAKVLPRSFSRHFKANGGTLFHGKKVLVYKAFKIEQLAVIFLAPLNNNGANLCGRAPDFLCFPWGTFVLTELENHVYRGQP